METKVAVLVSAGCHPASGRPRRSPGDARALELALHLAGEPLVLHAGDPDEPSLRDYLGMGLRELTVLECPAPANPIPALVAELAGRSPELILTGIRTERGPATGYLPYAVAQALEAAIAPAILAITPAEDGFHLAQALSGGHRRSLWAPGPAVALIDRAAPCPRPVAFGPGQRGTIRVRSPATPLPVEPKAEVRPARKRPKRLRVAGGTAAERQATIRGASGGEGRILTACSPKEAAQAIYHYLLDTGVLQNRTAEREEEPLPQRRVSG